MIILAIIGKATIWKCSNSHASSYRPWLRLSSMLSTALRFVKGARRAITGTYLNIRYAQSRVVDPACVRQRRIHIVDKRRCSSNRQKCEANRVSKCIVTRALTSLNFGLNLPYDEGKQNRDGRVCVRVHFRTCHRFFSSLSSSSPLSFPRNEITLTFERSFQGFCASRAREGWSRCHVSLFLSRVLPSPPAAVKFIPIKFQCAHCTRAFAKPPLSSSSPRRISASRVRCIRPYVCAYVPPSSARETGFPYVLISRRHRRNSVYTDTPRFLTRLCERLTYGRARARFRSPTKRNVTSSREHPLSPVCVPPVSHKIRSRPTERNVASLFVLPQRIFDRDYFGVSSTIGRDDEDEVCRVSS